MRTKADMLKFSIAFALRNVRTERHRLGLPEETRYQIAEDTIREMCRLGDWKELDDPLPEPPCGLTGPSKAGKNKAAS